MEKNYKTEKHLLDQIINKTLSIKENLYLGYELLFIFDNASNHSIYIKDVL